MDLESGEGSIASWEMLKKKARKIESTIISKLSMFSKLAVRMERKANGGNDSKRPLSSSSSSMSSPARPPAGDSSGDDSGSDTHLTLEKEIDSLIAQLIATAEEMQRWPSDNGGTADGSGSFGYLAQRYRSVAHEHALEFKRTRDGIAQSLTRSELTDGRGGMSTTAGLRPRAEMLLGEKQSLHNSLRQIDDVVGGAQNARDRLRDASNAFDAMRNRMSGIGKRFPAVNALISRIQASKNRESIWLGLTVAICMIFFFLFWTSR